MDLKSPSIVFFFKVCLTIEISHHLTSLRIDAHQEHIYNCWVKISQHL